MSPLRTLSRDLLERRLWPVAVLLVAAVVAVPALFLRSPDSGGAQAAAPVVPPVPATTTTSVASTLPQQVRELIDQTTATIPHAKVRGPIKDPFRLAEANGLSKTAPSPATTSATATSSTSSAAPAAPAPSSGGGTSFTPPSPAPSPAPGPAPKRVVPPDHNDKKSYDVFRADLQYGPDAKAKVARDVARLTAFPTSLDPVLLFLGVESGGADAVFAIRSDSRPTGAAACRPSAKTCLWLVVKPGDHVDLQVPDGKGATTHERLTVVHITRDATSDRAAAQAAYDRADAAGRCVLGVMGAFDYDSSTGTLRALPQAKDCNYTQPPSKTATATQPPSLLG